MGKPRSSFYNGTVKRRTLAIAKCLNAAQLYAVTMVAMAALSLASVWLLSCLLPN